MRNLKEFSNLYTFNFIGSLKLILSEAVKVQKLIKKCPVQKVILFLGIVNLEILTVVEQ